ncbi:MAG: DUF535 family protein, partial [Centipeda sp. (in: firmicutes)]
MIAEISDVARRAYRLRNIREGRRALIFSVRAVLYWKTLRELWRFFQETELRRALYARNPYPLEQATRAFFYAGSTVRTRIDLIRAQYAYLEQKMKPAD